TGAAYNGYFYVIGGANDGTPLNDVQVAQASSNGTIGAWSPTTSFTTARYGHSSVVYGGHLYVIGGNNGSVASADVQIAPIKSDGTLGTWTPTTALRVARNYHTSVVLDGYLYVAGGGGNSGY